MSPSNGAFFVLGFVVIRYIKSPDYTAQKVSSMAQIVSPVNIVAAALIIQFSLMLIFAFSALFLGAKRKHYMGEPEPATYRGLSGIVLLFSLATIGLLFFSDEFSNVWKPLFQDFDFSGIKWSHALFSIFILDIVWVSIMVGKTGGSVVSACSPIYFILPALAIFLRETSFRIIIYAFLVILSYTWNLIYNFRDYDENKDSSKLAYWGVSVASLILTTLIGYLTRPK